MTNDETETSATTADVTGTMSASADTSTTATETSATETSATETSATETSATETSTEESSSSTAADSSSSDGGSESSTGEPAEPGQTFNQLVTAGTRSSSASYTLVYTFGQPSQLQSTHTSASYRLQGGLIGANGSPP